MDTTYTVDESVGEVSVCVNLTDPMIDILDETVNVFVIDDSSSIYIPAGAQLASESLFNGRGESTLLYNIAYLIYNNLSSPTHTIIANAEEKPACDLQNCSY